LHEFGLLRFGRLLVSLYLLSYYPILPEAVAELEKTAPALELRVENKGLRES
jgi:hypothetical protein